MVLYSTTPLIEDYSVPYQVYKEGNRLFFKPMVILKDLVAPIFWVAEVEGNWEPINIQDDEFKNRIKDNIVQHRKELLGAA